jgi:Holliday junction resolvase RusA-like endonuclease
MALQPSKGKVVARQWYTKLTRHVVVVAALRPHPYVVQSRAFRSKRGTAYSNWKEATRPQITAALREAAIEPFPSNWVLGLAISAAATLSAPLGSPMTKKGAVDRRYVKSVRSWDATDLWKAIEDLGNGIIWKDDNQVRAMGPGAFADQSADAFALHAWGLPPGRGSPMWDEDWEDDSAPFTYEWLNTSI